MGFCGCHRILRVYMILGDAVSKLGTFVLVLNHHDFKVQNLVYVHPESIISFGGVRSNPTHTCLFRTTKSTSSSENEIKIITEKGNVTGKSIFDAGTRLSKF